MNQHNRTKPVLGLLGMPGAGKSYVAGVFGELGAAVIDADRIAHQLVDEPAVVDQLRQWWGPEVINCQGRADRKAIGEIVFNDCDAMGRLETLVHPRVRAERARLRRQYEADSSIRAIVEDSPLLIEKQVDTQCDRLILVDAPRAVRLQRLSQTRGWDQAELDRREKSQASLDIKRQRSEDTIVNDGRTDVHAQARRILHDNVERLAGPGPLTP